jgi:luciferase-like monooxygenase
MRDYLNRLQNTVTAWPGVHASPHRFGGQEFNLGSVEIGHIHLNGMVDIPYNSKIRQQLIAEGHAEPHHILKDTGWITFYIHTDADVEHAIWLFRLSYLFNAGRGQNRAALQDQLNITDELDKLKLSEKLRTIVDGLTKRRQQEEP